MAPGTQPGLAVAGDARPRARLARALSVCLFCPLSLSGQPVRSKHLEQDDNLVTRPATNDRFCTPSTRPPPPDSLMQPTPTISSSTASIPVTGPPRTGRHVRRDTAVRRIRPQDNGGNHDDLKRPRSRGYHGACPYESCGHRFTTAIKLARHLRIHAGKKPFVCPYESCGYASERSGPMTIHVRRHTGNKPFVCRYQGCVRAFVDSTKLTQHRRTHSGEKPFVCPFESCGHAFSQSPHLKRHLNSHLEDYVSCAWEGCGYLSTQPYDLKRHWRVHSGEQPFVCLHEGCGYTSAHSGNLNKHLRIHSKEKPFVCPRKDCGHSFTYQINLTRHMRIHSGEKPFVCPWEGCGHASRQSGNLKVHLYTHTGKKTLACPREGCAYQASHPGLLRRHLRVHSGKKHWVCSWQDCTYASMDSSKLKRHERVHSGEKPFVCSHVRCGRSFSHQISLTRHMRRHSREKTFVCPRQGCGHASRHPAGLTGHMRIHSGDKPFDCPRADCAKAYDRASNLQRHLKTHTKADPASDRLEGSDKTRRNTRGLTGLTESRNAASAFSCARTNGSTPGQTPGHAQPQPLPRARRPKTCHSPHCNRRCAQLPALKMHRHHHGVTPPGLGPDGKNGTRWAGLKTHKPQGRVRTGAPEGRAGQLRHIPCRSHRHQSRTARQLRPARTGDWPAAADSCHLLPDCRQAGMTRGQREARLRTQSRQSIAPAPATNGAPPASLRCSVIAWVSGGVVYKNAAPGK